MHVDGRFKVFLKVVAIAVRMQIYKKDLENIIDFMIVGLVGGWRLFRNRNTHMAVFKNKGDIY